MTWSDFFYMGGYAFYVWGAYLVALIAIGGEVLLVWKRRKRCSLGQTGDTFSEL